MLSKNLPEKEQRPHQQMIPQPAIALIRVSEYWKRHILSDGRIQREFLQQQSLIHRILEQKQQEADQHF